MALVVSVCWETVLQFAGFVPLGLQFRGRVDPGCFIRDWHARHCRVNEYTFFYKKENIFSLLTFQCNAKFSGWLLLIAIIISDRNRKKRLCSFNCTILSLNFWWPSLKKTRQITKNLKKVFWQRKVNRTKLSPKVCSTLADFEYSVKILARNLL